MTMKPTADQLAKAIEASGMTHREIADRVGINHVSAISMMIQGITRVPLQRIPALAQTLGMNERAFLVLAIKEYHPDVYEVLVDLLGLPLSDAELDIVATFRLDSLRAGIDVTGPFKTVLRSLLELARAGRN